MHWLVCLLVCMTQDSPEWLVSHEGDLWSVRHAGDTAGLIMTCPGDVESQPPEWAETTRTETVPASPRVDLSFRWRDSFEGPTAGHHFLRVFVGGEPVWESDVIGGDRTWRHVRLDVTEQCAGKSSVTIALRAENRKRVTNFPVSIEVTDVALAEGTPPEPPLPWKPLPPDLPIPSLPVNGMDWTRQAVILQPWGVTQYEAMHKCEDLPRQLADEFGLNAIIVLPPDAHRYTTKPGFTLTDGEFRDALAAYRAAGFRVILYSSVMHVGHSETWEDGTVEREHPEWSQRDAVGGAISKYGHQWLCPSTGALDYAIDYTLGLVEQYEPDGIMLDNNQFYQTAAGRTCYCEGCQAAFRDYVRERFAHSTRDYFRINASEVRIPVEDGPLKNLWIHWRNRVWAASNEEFRARLRAVKPDIMFFANTQYLWPNWLLAADFQYAHEDVVLSESRKLQSVPMSCKMLLGRALAGGRPLWNYLGTFDETDFTRLVAPDMAGRITAATLAHQACPWLVYYGFDPSDTRNTASQQILADLFGFRAARPELFLDLTPWAPVVTLFAPRSRNFLGTPLIPDHVQPLLSAGVALGSLSAMDIETADLSPTRVLIAEHVGCLTDEAAARLAAWVSEGGTLVATGDLGAYDALGRLRPASALAESLGVEALRTGAVGRGRLVVCTDGPTIVRAVKDTGLGRFRVGARGPAAGSPIEVRPYTRRDGAFVLHVVNHGQPISAPWSLRMPAGMADAARAATVFRPSGSEGQEAAVSASGGLAVTMPPMAHYCVLSLRSPSR